MNRELAMAYDLLHQVQSLSWEEKNSAWVDNVPTDQTLLQRAELLVRHLERSNQQAPVFDYDEGDESIWANEESIRQGRQQ
jgi:hypothetical protein